MPTRIANRRDRLTSRFAPMSSAGLAASLRSPGFTVPSSFIVALGGSRAGPRRRRSGSPPVWIDDHLNRATDAARLSICSTAFSLSATCSPPKGQYLPNQTYLSGSLRLRVISEVKVQYGWGLLPPCDRAQTWRATCTRLPGGRLGSNE